MLLGCFVLSKVKDLIFVSEFLQLFKILSESKERDHILISNSITSTFSTLYRLEFVYSMYHGKGKIDFYKSGRDS